MEEKVEGLGEEAGRIPGIKKRPAGRFFKALMKSAFTSIQLKLTWLFSALFSVF
ncbi:hypothetical protein ABMA58_20575 [Oceanospirillum sp. HFRX-1_2]